MKSKIAKIFLDDVGSFLGRGEGCLIVSDKKRIVEKYPLFENQVGEVQVKIGNSISRGALATCAFWEIDLLILTQRGNPVAYLRSLDDDSHVKTRLCQYEALKDGRAFEIAKQFVKSKIEGQNQVLKKYGLKTDTSVKLRIDAIETEDLKTLRRKLMQIEAKFSQFYFKQILQLIPERIRPEGRKTFKAYDGVNNLFNLTYEMLAWKVHRALINAKLEPYLGFLHSEQYGKPSLVCDFQELYRYLIDDFLIGYCKNVKANDFTAKTENLGKKKRSKRIYLNDVKTGDITNKLNEFFKSTIEIPRIRVGERQTIATLINEEALRFARYLRNESRGWKPRTKFPEK
jgi:CRISPR-associated protein Cas1